MSDVIPADLFMNSLQLILEPPYIRLSLLIIAIFITGKSPLKCLQKGTTYLFLKIEYLYNACKGLAAVDMEIKIQHYKKLQDKKMAPLYFFHDLVLFPRKLH